MSTDRRYIQMRCISDRCQSGRIPCPTPEVCEPLDRAVMRSETLRVALIATVFVVVVASCSVLAAI